MSPDRMKEWAEDLVNNPIGVSDDYGNLIVSLGLALKQPPQEMHDAPQCAQSNTVQDPPEQSGVSECPSKPGTT